ncbi:hypothetical protein BU17DRAFT_100411 [Hysterangium stoloniferum]|nr:hypothetical protein BU17DRAFT_100411 [Hysterangium stoloniferum]
MDVQNVVNRPDGDDKEPDEDSEELARSLKRRRTSKRKEARQSSNPNGYRGRNVGKLSKLLEMPVDIFCEISNHLEPIDLLHLARSTKGLNAILMSRESKPIWRSARQSYPTLPDCPPDLSEPEYARLIFEKDCHVCLAPRVMKVEWAMRTRICHRCRPDEIVKGSQLLDEIPGLTNQLLECIPCRFSHARLGGNRRRKLEFFCRSRVERMVAKFSALVPADMPPVLAKVARDEFYEYHKGLLPDIHKNANELGYWIRLEASSKHDIDTTVSITRKKAIYTRLIELGHEEVDFPYEWDAAWSSLVFQPRALTPRIWATIRPKLEASIATLKAQRESLARRHRKTKRTDELRSYLKDFLKTREDYGVPLSFSEDKLLTFPAAESLLGVDDYRKEITGEVWVAAKDQFEKETRDCYDRVCIQAKQLVASARDPDASKAGEDDAQKSTKNSPLDIEDDYLSLPTTLFHCTPCDRVMPFKWILRHSHIGFDQPTWPLDFTFSPQRTAIAEAIFISNPSLKEDLPDECADETIYMCICCDQSGGPCPMTFSELISHFISQHEWYIDPLVRRYWPKKASNSTGIDGDMEHTHDMQGSPRWNVHYQSEPEDDDGWGLGYGGVSDMSSDDGGDNFYMMEMLGLH